jgi:phage terminase large subunit
LKDLRAAKGLKGLENYDGAWVDEAEDIPTETWDVLIPTFRKKGSELWVSFNRNREMDPAYKMFFVNPPPGTMAMELRPGRLDNPWFPEKLLEKMEHDYATRPDIAEHIWGGKPKAQGDNCVFTRAAIRAAMNRKVEPTGAKALGVDVARFGADNSELWLRQGMTVVSHRTIRGQDTIAVATAAWEMVNKDPSIPIKVDDGGVGGGVSDQLKHWGAKVIRVNFGAKSTQPNKYADLATEMWFEFPIDEVSLPDDEELMDELSERRYDYDKNEVKRIESKKDFKPRIGRSPDKADALLLSFYTGKTIEYDEETRRALLARRNR